MRLSSRVSNLLRSCIRTERRWLATPPGLSRREPHLNDLNGHSLARSADPLKYVEAHAVHGGESSVPATRALEDAPSDVLSFSEATKPDVIRAVCRRRVPGWQAINEKAICIDQLCEGLSNQNFKVHVPPSEATVPCVLFRVYGKDVDALYDADLELRIFNVLSTYQIAPQMYASGSGWRVEEWHFSVPLPNRSMRNPSIFSQVAAHLGRLHKLSSREDFPRDIKALPTHSSQRFQLWAENCKKTLDGFSHPDLAKKGAAFDIDEMVAECKWLSEYCIADDPKIKGSGMDVVFSHWDPQENNVLQTHYGLRFIDFEYAGMEHQAFDIASYFVECTIDYLVDDFPNYKVSLSDFPSDWEQRLFCSLYLSEYLETTVRPDDLAVSVLLQRVRRFTLVSHLLWSFWSVIRAGQAPTYGGFDYLHYSQTRWFMYKWAKRALLHEAAQARVL